MHFGEQFEAAIHAPWASRYVRYAALRDVLRTHDGQHGRCLHRRRSQYRRPVPADDEEYVRAYADSFARKLDRDVENVDIFALHVTGLIASEITETAERAFHIGGTFTGKRIEKLTVDDAEDIRELLDDFLKIGNDLVLLVDYLYWNLRAVNRLKEKVSRATRRAGPHHSYALQRHPHAVQSMDSIDSIDWRSIAPPTGESQQETQQSITELSTGASLASTIGSLDGTTALVRRGEEHAGTTSSARQRSESNSHHFQQPDLGRDSASRTVALRAARLHLSSLCRCHHLHTIEGLVATIARWLDRLVLAEETAVFHGAMTPLSQEQTDGGDSGSHRERRIVDSESIESHHGGPYSNLEHNTMFHRVEAGSTSRSQVDRLLRKLVLHMSTLKGSGSYFQKTLAVQAGIFCKPDEVHDDAFYDDEQRRLAIPSINFVLNSTLALVYMLSYYCILPTAGTYATNLGSSRAVSGVLIGIAPLAGILSNVFFSRLSPQGFKKPLMLTSFTCLLGNLVYALAWTFRSLSIAVIGRFFIGFGGARAVNRRFIADYAPRSQRVQRSAEFVTYSAIGMAGGPALSSVIDAIPSRRVTGVMFNSATNPPWTMVILWAIYLMAMCVFFTDPGDSRAARDQHPDGGENGRKTNPENNMEEIDVQNRPATSDPSTPLLENSASDDSNYGSVRQNPVSGDLRRAWQLLSKNRSVLFCLWLYFLVQFMRELLLSSAALFLPYRFGWSEGAVGIFIAVLGCLMFPANAFVSRLADSFDDHKQLVHSLATVTAGCMVIFPLLSHVALFQYMIAGIVLSVAANVGESVLMAILARIMPHELARGAFDSGLLISEAGMLGRAAGNMAVSLAGSGKHGDMWLMWRAFVPAVIFSAVSLRAALSLQEDFADDGDSSASETEDEESHCKRVIVLNNDDDDDDDDNEDDDDDEDEENDFDCNDEDDTDAEIEDLKEDDSDNEEDRLSADCNDNARSDDATSKNNRE